MSSSAGDGQGQEGRESRTSVGKAFIKRIALRIRGGTATPDTTSTPPSIREEPVDQLVVDEDPSETESRTSPAEESESTVPQLPPQSDIHVVPIPISYLRGVDRQERTRRLLAKYGLSIESQDWMPTDSTVPTTVLRVEKPIRMRVRYTCHLCENLFGIYKHCKRCNHRRCDDCPRHPSKRSKTKDDANKGNSNSAKDILTLRKREHGEIAQITRSRSRRSKPAPDGPTPVLQLLQHVCHKCKTHFERRGRLCSTCGHLRCARCPRNLADWNYGASGDERLRPDRVYRQPRQRIRWICDHCQCTFTEGSRVCAECLHKRCDACSRIPPKRARLDDEEDNETTQERVRMPGIS